MFKRVRVRAMLFELEEVSIEPRNGRSIEDHCLER
jgi:hypothetical protein